MKQTGNVAVGTVVDLNLSTRSDKKITIERETIADMRVQLCGCRFRDALMTCRRDRFENRMPNHRRSIVGRQIRRSKSPGCFFQGVFVAHWGYPQQSLVVYTPRLEGCFRSRIL